MRRIPFAVAAFALTGAAALSQDVKPVQPAPPPAVQPKAEPTKGNPWATTTSKVTAAKMAVLEEEFETLEAHRDVKKAYVKVAEVGVHAAEVEVIRLKAAAVRGIGELDRAVVQIEMAKANLEIRLAEMKEVEVKVKYAKKRLDEAKAAGVRPAPGLRPAPIDPKATDPLPNVRFADEQAVADLKAKIEKLTAEAAKVAADAAKAEADRAVAEKELARILKIAQLGRVKAGTIEAAEAKAKDAKETAEKLAKQLKTIDASLADLRAKLKEVEK